MDSDFWTIVLITVAAGVMGWPTVRQMLMKIPNVDPQDMKRRLAGRDEVFLIDVRSEGEFAGGHIKDSVNVPIGLLPIEIAKWKDRFGPYKSTPVVVVCQTGRRAKRAAAMLKYAGLLDVAVLKGGMNAWQAGGLPVEKEGPHAS